MIRDFVAHDLSEIDLQPSQAFMREHLTQAFGVALERQGGAKTAVWNGKPVACAGISDWNGLPYAWAFLGTDVRPAMLEASRACEAALIGRGDVITHVRMDIPANKRWLRLLGFATTGRIETLPDGREYELWVRTHD